MLDRTAMLGKMCSEGVPWVVKLNEPSLFIELNYYYYYYYYTLREHSAAFIQSWHISR